MLFFVPNFNNHFNANPVGIINANLFLVCMILKLKKNGTQNYNDPTLKT